MVARRALAVYSVVVTDRGREERVCVCVCVWQGEEWRGEGASVCVCVCVCVHFARRLIERRESSEPSGRTKDREGKAGAVSVNSPFPASLPSLSPASSSTSTSSSLLRPVLMNEE